MPTSLQRSIALVGAGSLGQHILRALLTSPSHPNVVVLTRPESKNDLPGDLHSATIIPVDYTNVAALTTLFKEHSIEVVISVVPPPAYTTVQHALADAAKASGTVKLFVPSEWGLPTEGAKEKGEENLFAVKDEVAEYLKSIELPYTRFYTGMFMAYVPWLVGIDVDGRVHIQGKGETPFTLTSQEDIGGFVGHVLTSLALTSPELVNASLRIQGQRLTLREYARIVNKPVVTVAQDESLPVKTEGEKAFKTFLQNQVESGKASTGWDRKTEKEIDGAAGSANKLWEGHVWQTVHLQNLDVRESKGTSWRALSSAESTPSSFSVLLGALSQLDSAVSCFRALSRKYRFYRCEEQLVLQSPARFGDGWYNFALHDSITDQDELCGGRK